MAEVHQVGQRLAGRLGDNAAWFEEWERMAAETERKADAEAAAGHEVTAGGLYQRAATYHFVADRFLSPQDPRKNAAYRCVIRCFREAARRRYPNLEFVDVPYDPLPLAAHFIRPEGAKPYRAMVFFDGLDTAKEMLSFAAGSELARRGIACLVVDGPGQGESLRLRGIPSRYDYEVPAAAAIDWLERRADVDRDRIGVMAISMGGYYAPRAAACEKRFKVCVAWGGHYDYHAVWLNRRRVMESGGTTTSAPTFQLPWVLGVRDMDQAMEKLKKYTLEGVAEKITCPLLVAHGEHDSIVPVEMARRLHEAAGSAVKELKIFTAEETGSEHCMGDNRQLGAAFVADWIADHL